MTEYRVVFDEDESIDDSSMFNVQSNNENQSIADTNLSNRELEQAIYNNPNLTTEEKLEQLNAILDKDVFPATFFDYAECKKEIDLTNINRGFFRCRALTRELKKKWGLTRDVSLVYYFIFKSKSNHQK